MLIPQDVYKGFLTAGNEWADKHGAAELLESTLKSLHAQIAIEFKRSEGCSVAEAEKVALACSDYRDAAEQAIQARIAANKAKVRYQATQALWEAQRTAESSERAAMRAAP